MTTWLLQTLISVLTGSTIKRKAIWAVASDHSSGLNEVKRRKKIYINEFENIKEDEFNEEDKCQQTN